MALAFRGRIVFRSGLYLGAILCMHIFKRLNLAMLLFLCEEHLNLAHAPPYNKSINNLNLGDAVSGPQPWWTGIGMCLTGGSVHCSGAQVGVHCIIQPRKAGPEPRT